MSNTTDTVSDYIAAWTTGEVDSAVALVDERFTLQTAMDTIHGKDGLRSTLEHFKPVAAGARTLQRLADGDDVCTIIELNLALPDSRRSLILSEVDHVHAGRLTSSLLIFDSAALQAETRRTAGTGATIDPVCGMPVEDPDAPTRRYNGHEYRFCSPTCAKAFDQFPERFTPSQQQRVSV